MGANPADLGAHSDASDDRIPAPWWAWGCTGELGPGDFANYRRFVVLGLVWVAGLFVAVLSLRLWADALGPVAYAVALVPTLLFLAVIGAYVRFLRGADELTRKIHMEGMAAAFGTGLVVLLGYPIVESVGAPALDLGDATAPMVLAYVIATQLAQRRYR